MADIRCPMCGESASQELDICPFCQARLKPLVNSSTGDDGSIRQEEEPIQPEEADTRENTAELESALPAWLRNLRKQSEDKLPADEPDKPEESLPGILETNELSEPSDANLPVRSTEEEAADWLSGLEQTAQKEDETPAWLSNIKDLPKKQQLPAEETIENANVGEGNWLDRLRGDAPEQELTQDEQPPETPQEEPVFKEDLPDWMKKLQAEVDSQTEAFNPEEESQTEDGKTGSPDWLTRLQAETQSYAAENENSVSGQAEETPDWLEKMSVETPVSSEENTPSEIETPDWLLNLQTETQAFAEDGLPLQAEPQVFAEGDLTTGSETPNLFKELDSELQNFSEVDSLAETTGEFSNIQSNLPLSESDELEKLTFTDNEPDWLSNLEVAGQISQPEAGEQLQTGFTNQPPDSELIPVWLQNIDNTETIPNNTPAQISGDQFLNENESGALPPAEFPDLLLKLKADTPVPQPEEENLETEPADGDIAPAKLPSWVQAMRPVESMIAEVGVPDNQLEQITEKAGPLAGLSGVLPATPGLGNVRKPLNISIKLRVTDEQNQQATQLKQMLGIETQSTQLTQVVKKQSQRVLRWVVALLMILAVGLPAFSNIQIISTPSIYPPELVAARDVLLGLPPASPVLLVFDYEPAYSGELEATAAPLVDNLLFSGARLAILSTSPTGPTLAEHFLKTTQGKHDYQSGQQYANLGYLAGGASGVLSFALNPSQTIPYALDGSLPWQTPLLQDIHTLADFDMVIILTDNSDTARIWVEQTGSILGQKPMLMAISAQAEPMIRPYYDSKQIKGLVTGLAGGKAYEQAQQSSGLGQQYWDSFSSGLFIAELIIILGSVWSIISVWRKRKSANEEEA
ncbi:MAG: hypothetical protein A2X25_15035 [Chloroflexi bacterium GWB2_49_20]|nr:MAG: hypothetical protein A2X25_15035 [Chloroflexi bacterium GWB2_49_20]OGN80447.1 MAG: hypothetical protein A2X26_12780 [Chloroflexi bacterium GWC2_49_37]OGN84271.1 MAG: hypothetical protein A2X27_12580 [Chloroflexi bacterium GWD2_49_16]